MLPWGSNCQRTAPTGPTTCSTTCPGQRNTATPQQHRLSLPCLRRPSRAARPDPTWLGSRLRLVQVTSTTMIYPEKMNHNHLPRLRLRLRHTESDSDSDPEPRTSEPSVIDNGGPTDSRTAKDSAPVGPADRGGRGHEFVPARPGHRISVSSRLCSSQVTTSRGSQSERASRQTRGQ